MDKLKLKLIAEDFEEEAFYEDIEAPKFVDFKRSDPFIPDDRYWFCSRVGCDLKHEQEIDAEAVFKNFVLRAMAARSPNLRFQKALNKRLENKKCALSAPPKPSKSRIPRLALLSSVSRKLLDDKDAPQPPPKPTTTPKARVKYVAAKYMTTPRVKHPVAESKPFRSVRNELKTSSRIPKPKLVAKSLTFTSPKKKIMMKTKPLEDQSTTTPIKKLCDGIKKLEITDKKKAATGELRSARACKKVLGSIETQEGNEKSSRRLNGKIKGIAQKKDDPKSVLCDGIKKPETTDLKKATKGELRGARAGKRVVGNTKTREENEKKSSKHVNSKIKGVAQKKDDTKSVLCEVGPGHISSKRMDMNTAERSCSSGPCSESAKPDHGEGTTMASSENETPNSDTTEERVLVETENSGPCSESAKPDHGEGTTMASSENETPNSDTTEERVLVETENSGMGAQITKDSHSNAGSGNDQNPSSDEKENAPICDINRDFTANGQSEGDHGVKPEAASKKTKVVQTVNKGSLKENRSGGLGIQGVKHKKPKTTNPKPFRFRTDERKILKEANPGKKAS